MLLLREMQMLRTYLIVQKVLLAWLVTPSMISTFRPKFFRPLNANRFHCKFSVHFPLSRILYVESQQVDRTRGLNKYKIVYSILCRKGHCLFHLFPYYISDCSECCIFLVWWEFLPEEFFLNQDWNHYCFWTGIVGWTYTADWTEESGTTPLKTLEV